MSKLSFPKRWNIYLINLNPKRGTKPGKQRPCLIVQNENFNFLGASIIIPITSQVLEETKPIRVNIPAGISGLLKSSDLMIDQMMAWDHKRIISHIGTLPTYLIEETKEAIKEFLDLE